MKEEQEETDKSDEAEKASGNPSLVCADPDTVLVAARAQTEVVRYHVVPFLLYHGPEPWTRNGHWTTGCGQSCGCCRSHNPEEGACCSPCYEG